MLIETVCITLDKTTKEKVDQYARSHAISRSSAIRTLLNEFFARGYKL